MKHLTRQYDILPPEKTITPIVVIGAGAIGSFVTLALAKMGFDDITVWDYDRIDEENMNCQFYRFSDIKKFKVEALQEIVQDFANVKIKIRNDKFTQHSVLHGGIVIAAVDSMAARAEIMGVCMHYVNISHFIDTRMTAESALMYTINPQVKRDREFYTKSWYPDNAAEVERCTAKSTMYTVLAISSQVCANVKAIAMDQPYCRSLQWAIADFDYYAFKETTDGNEINQTKTGPSGLSNQAGGVIPPMGQTKASSFDEYHGGGYGEQGGGYGEQGL